ncbi:MAG: alpha/beta hydrolase [Gammaproteobacteria bacterium]|nr:MAG: alpha/beta hydrolase [Gammaproteobacteria bacterium]
MPLEPATAALLNQLAEAGGPTIDQLTPAEGRAMYRMMQPPGDDIAVGGVENRQISGPGASIPIRIYRPQGSGPFPVHVHFHGGGWVIGDLETHDADCRQLCQLADVIVVAVDYRLAPEHRYPAAVEDCYAATVWAAAHGGEFGGREGPVSVGGDSAGGNLAAVVSRLARDRNGPGINLQLLLYPVVDAAMDTPSYTENGDGYMLTRQGMEWFWTQYCPDPAQRLEPDASPLRASDLSGLPPALVMTAEFDPLRDEGESYAQRLTEAGVEVTCERYAGLIHGFFSQARNIPAARPALEAAAAAIRAAHAG